MTDRNQQRPPRAADWVAFLFSVVVLAAVAFLERGENRYLRAISVPILAAAGLFMFVPFYLLKRYGQVDEGKSYMDTTVVVDRGLYSVVRHPQYLGYTFLVVGFILLSQNWLIAVPGVLAIVCFYLQSVAEERFCREKFGKPYQQYLRHVPRFNFVGGIIRLFRTSSSRLRD